jgi:uncharacterized protein YbjT (DUF2867 family)
MSAAEGSRGVVFVTGGTGYLGRPLIERLLRRGWRVKALVRASSAARLPHGAEPVVGDALDGSTYQDEVAGVDFFVHLVGTPKPAPWKGDEFRRVDLASAKQAGAAARAANVRRFVYVSVANPAPVMRSYIAARLEAESYLIGLGLDCRFIRPWYVLGPGHWWPLALVPFYAIAKWIPSWREPAHRLRLWRHAEMISALVAAVES